MAKINVYSSEDFERSKLRYVVFSSVFIMIFAVSIFYKNIVWAILMFFLLGWYLYYGIINNKEIPLKISNNWLVIWDKTLERNRFSGYVLEIDQKKQEIKNIVFITHKHHNIYTINDIDKNIKEFIEELNNYLDMTDHFSQTFWEKTSRKLKL